MWAIVVKEFRQLRRDRRTVAMLLMLPFLFLIIFGYAASFDVKDVKAIVVGPLADPVASALPDRVDVVGTYPDEDEPFARDALRDGEAVVAIVTSSSPATLFPTPRDGDDATTGTPDTGARILVDGSELFAARAAVTLFAQVQARAEAGDAATSVVLPRPEILYNPDLKTSVIMVPGLCGIILVFVGTVATALGVVRERQAGTLEQLAVMPFRPADVFVGKIAPYLAIAALDMVVIVLVGMLLFGVPFAGSVATFALGAALFLFVTLGIGVLVSTVSQTQGQAIQLAMMTMLPQFLLSGLFFPLYSMPWGVRWIGYCLPLTWFVKTSTRGRRGSAGRGRPAARPGRAGRRHRAGRPSR